MCRLPLSCKKHNFETKKDVTTGGGGGKKKGKKTTRQKERERKRREEEGGPPARHKKSPPPVYMGISRDSLHKRRATGGKLKPWRKARKYVSF